MADTPGKEGRSTSLVIQKKADVLERMIEQLMLLTKMDVGEKVLPQESINLSHLTKEIIDENKISWEKSGLNLKRSWKTMFRSREAIYSWNALWKTL